MTRAEEVALEDKTLDVKPGPRTGTVKSEDGEVLTIPAGWGLLEPGDATLTRRVKKAGPSWTVKTKKGRKVFSQGVWAPQEHIDAQRTKLEAERQTPSYKKKLAASRKRRAVEQENYVQEFEESVLTWLRFDDRYADIAATLASAVTAHATPVGSGTVARTKRISVDERAQAAVIAWMRHQTTAYDNMSIPRVKGARREVRRKLARRSVELLGKYRRGEDQDLEKCPLYTALDQPEG